MSKVLDIILFAINIIFSFIVVCFSDTIYLGASFDCSIAVLIFNIIIFLCFSLSLINRDNCLFSDKNVFMTLRYKSRKALMKYEINNVLFKSFLYVLVHTLTIFISNIFFGRYLILSEIIIYFFLNISIFSLCVILQLFLELFVTYNFASFIIVILYVIGFVGGWVMWRAYTHSSNSINAKWIKIMNIFDLYNYLSLSHSYELGVNPFVPIFFSIVCVILCIVIMIYLAKRIDLLSKE